MHFLHLEETPATDAGLRELAELTSLQKLRLEGALGGQDFTDAGLAAIPARAELLDVTLYGSGFTNNSLPLLLEMPKLRSLRLLDTGVTSEALTEFKKKRPTLQISSQLGQ